METYEILDPETFLDDCTVSSPAKKLLKYLRIISLIAIVFFGIVCVFSLILPNHQAGSTLITGFSLDCILIVVVLHCFFEVYLRYKNKRYWQKQLSQTIYMNSDELSVTKTAKNQISTIKHTVTTNYDDISKLIWDQEKHLLFVYATDINSYKDSKNNRSRIVKNRGVKGGEYIGIFLEDSFSVELIEQLRHKTGLKVIILK